MLSPFDLLCPPICVGCNKIGTRLCANCQTHLTWLDPDWNLISLQGLPVELGHVWTAVEYRDLATNLVKKVKYQHFYDYCRLMAKLMWLNFGQTWTPQQFDTLVPVPLAPPRQRWRGYNQAGKIAQELGKLSKIPVNARLLYRQMSRINQAKLNRLERQALKHDFALNPKFTNQLSGKNICLIDDVITTGATLKTCAQLFSQAGAKVQVASFAVTISGKV